MPRKRKYDAYFDYVDDGTAECLIKGCTRPKISRSQSNGMPKHLRVHHPAQYKLLTSAVSTQNATVPFKASEVAVNENAEDDGPEFQANGQAAMQDVGEEPEHMGDIEVVDESQDDGQAVDEAEPAQLGADGEYDSEQEWEVDAILDKRVTVEYFLKWKGYGDEANSWEKAANLTHCDELLEDFNAPHPPVYDEEAEPSTEPLIESDQLPDI